MVRGKWEERSRAESQLERTPSTASTSSSASTEGRARALSMTPSGSAHASPEIVSRSSSTDRFSVASPSPTRTDRFHEQQQYTTPPMLKRQTMPAPIIASPLSPNTTGITIESPDSPTQLSPTPTPQRIRLPVSSPLGSSSVAALKQLSDYAVPSSPQHSTQTITSSRLRRANTLDSVNPSSTGSSTSSDQSGPSAGPGRISRVWPPEPPSPTTATVSRRPTSMYGSPFSAPPSPDKIAERFGGRVGSSATLSRASSLSPDKPTSSAHQPSSAASTSDTSSVMSPAPYRSSYMANKRATLYGDNLTTGRRFGRHLPRIASGDAPEDWVDESKPLGEPSRSRAKPFLEREDTPKTRAEPFQTHEGPPQMHADSLRSGEDSRRARAESLRVREELSRTHEPLHTHDTPRTRESQRTYELPSRSREPPLQTEEEAPQTPPKTEFKDWRTRREERLRRERERNPPSPEKYRDAELLVPGVTDAGDVAGVPGRIRLSKDKAPSAPTSPLPSSRLTRGLWADVQRHLIQAYEYLCHVGEAQQWIEGCLGEELDFGVVEMEEGLRNGVVLARLVRVFQGESSVRRIYDVSPALSNSTLLYAELLCRPQSSTSDIRTTLTISSASSARWDCLRCVLSCIEYCPS